MAPPPPSQAGKFKPRKPAKKIRVGGATSAAASSGVDGGDPRPDVARSSGNRGGRGDRSGRGRGGRGRGRGRAPLPQGRAFFNAQPAAASTARRGTIAQRRNAERASQSNAGAAESSSNAALKRQNATEEEIVGTLSEAVGSMIPASVGSAAATDERKSKFGNEVTAFDRALMGGEDDAGVTQTGPEGYMYDSDTSDEEETRVNKKERYKSKDKQPLTLPFPSMGVGQKQHYKPKTAADKKVPKKQHNRTSPFDNKDSEDSWFLFQLPTRLPSIEQEVKLKTENMHGDEKVVDYQEDGYAMGRSTLETAAVATPPVNEKAFDNCLISAQSGRLGKLKVYKSGKMVLVLEGSDGSSIELNVNEGLSVGFRQQGAVINLKKGDFVPIGEVKKTLIVSPNMEAAFTS